MALLEGPPCRWGHPDCTGHSVTPDLRGFPDRDTPNAGRCWCGAITYLWHVPLDDRFYCRACLRMALRIAVYPARFPDA